MKDFNILTVLGVVEIINVKLLFYSYFNALQFVNYSTNVSFVQFVIVSSFVSYNSTLYKISPVYAVCFIKLLSGGH